ncbi:MAG: BlaI/MecI/CopY family transcriptional regulator [Oscillospiraceae bacterium]|nr:BlaI/MecI/CopY family transcriptional regulator [Oscillospiraceae bacterium]
MEQNRLGTVEARFADLVWEHAPLTSGQLVKLCEAELSWKKSTTYTVLKKLCDRGLFQNSGGTVTPLMTRAEYYGQQSHAFVEESFNGSLPAFIAAFSQRRKLTAKEVAEIRAMIDAMEVN